MSRFKKQAETLVERLSAAKESGKIPQYRGLVAFGSCSTKEASSKSDIDIEVIVPEFWHLNKDVFAISSAQKSLDVLADNISNELKMQVHFWLKSESAYKGLAPFSSTPADLFALDGWDGLDSDGLRSYVKMTGVGLDAGGVAYLGMIPSKRFSARDAYERFAVSTMDLASGIGGDDHKLAKAVLRAQTARQMLEIGSFSALNEDVANSAKGTSYEKLLRKAYATKVVSQQGIFKKVGYFLKHFEWPSKTMCFEQYDDQVIPFFVELKRDIAARSEQPTLQAQDAEDLHRQRTSHKIIEELFKGDEPSPYLGLIFGEEMFRYVKGTTLENTLKIPLRHRTIPFKKLFDYFKSVNQVKDDFNLDDVVVSEWTLPYEAFIGHSPDAERLFNEQLFLRPSNRMNLLYMRYLLYSESELSYECSVSSFEYERLLNCKDLIINFSKTNVITRDIFEIGMKCFELIPGIQKFGGFKKNDPFGISNAKNINSERNDFFNAFFEKDRSSVPAILYKFRHCGLTGPTKSDYSDLITSNPLISNVYFSKSIYDMSTYCYWFHNLGRQKTTAEQIPVYRGFFNYAIDSLISGFKLLSEFSQDEKLANIGGYTNSLFEGLLGLELIVTVTNQIHDNMFDMPCVDKIHDCVQLIRSHEFYFGHRGGYFSNDDFPEERLDEKILHADLDFFMTAASLSAKKNFDGLDFHHNRLQKLDEIVSAYRSRDFIGGVRASALLSRIFYSIFTCSNVEIMSKFQEFEKLIDDIGQKNKSYISKYSYDAHLWTAKCVLFKKLGDDANFKFAFDRAVLTYDEESRDIQKSILELHVSTVYEFLKNYPYSSSSDHNHRLKQL